MDYEYFHIRSRNWLGAALHYSSRGQFDAALWCCERSIELEYRGIQGLVVVSKATEYKHKFQIRVVEKVINKIKLCHEEKTIFTQH